MFKRLLSLLFVLVIGFTLIACNNNTDKTTTGDKGGTTTGTTTGEQTTTGKTDTIPPAFIGAVEGKILPLEHLKDEEIDLLQNVNVRDETTKTQDIIVSVKDYGGYDKSVPGVYTIVIEAKDEAGNAATVERVVTVLDTLSQEINAVVIGDKQSAYVLNEEGALSFTTSGTKFRTKDIIQVMTKEFFIAEYNEHKEEHTNNGKIPFFPNGVLLIIDEDGKVVHARIAAGALIQINSDGGITTEDLTWTNSVDATNGGGLFKGLIEQAETLIPDGGQIMFVGNTAPEVSRKFFISALFYSGYTGGATNADEFDVDITDLTVTLEDKTIIIPVPDKLPAPVISVEDYVLKWEAVANASKYLIFVDGEKVEETTSTSFRLADLDLAVTPEGEDGYEIQVQAVTKDLYQWSTSEKSDVLVYKQIEIQDLDAPVVTIDGKTVKWNLVDGADSYKVFIEFAGKTIELGTTDEDSFDLSDYGKLYAGYSRAYVVALGDDAHYDSDNSNKELVFLSEVETFVINGYKTDVIKTTAWNYFSRRNIEYSKDKTGFAASPFLYLITDIHEITKAEFDVNATEAFSTVVLLDKDGKTKAINNILASQTWVDGEGWISDGVYTNNNSQINNLKPLMSEGDMLLIGKNDNMLTIENPDETTTSDVNGRNFIAHFYVKENATGGPKGVSGSEGWRAGLANLSDPSDVTFEIVAK